MLDAHEPWKSEALDVDRIRAEIAVVLDQLLPSLPPGDRTRGFLAYLRAAEKCLEGAKLFAEGKDFSVQQPRYAIDEFKAVADLLGLAGLAAASIEQDMDVAQVQKLPLGEWKLVRSVAELILLQDPEAAARLEIVRPAEGIAPTARREFHVVFKNRRGGRITNIWYAEPGMDVDRVCRALGQYLRAGVDPAVVYPAPEPDEVSPAVEAVPPPPVEWDCWEKERELLRSAAANLKETRKALYDRQPDEGRRRFLLGEVLGMEDSIGRALLFTSGEKKFCPDDLEGQAFWVQQLVAKDASWRRFYAEHPYVEIAPIELPPDDAWEEKPADFLTAGEFRLSFSLEPCKSWSAFLSRKTFVGEMPLPDRGVVHALVLSRIMGASTKEKAKEAVVAAARVAGWVK